MGKKTLTVFLLAMLCAASFAGPRFLKKELPPRKIAIDEKQVLTFRREAPIWKSLSTRMHRVSLSSRRKN